LIVPSFDWHRVRAGRAGPDSLDYFVVVVVRVDCAPVEVMPVRTGSPGCWVVPVARPVVALVFAPSLPNFGFTEPPDIT
jgi:hypothetical protein